MPLHFCNETRKTRISLVEILAASLCECGAEGINCRNGIWKDSLIAWGCDMKKFLLAGIAAAALLSAPALAADLPAKAPVYKAAPAPLFNWSGFYVGGHAGGGWADPEWTRLSGSFVGIDSLGLSAIPQRQQADGFLGGAQFGVNAQAGSWVYGLEASYSAGSVKGSNNGPLDDVYTTKFNDVVLAVGRLGYAWDRLLVYGKGGYAGASVKITQTDPTPGDDSGSARKWHNGWTLGAGVEYALANNWILGVEYNYVDLQTKNYTLVGNSSGQVEVLRVDPGAFHTVWARLSYKFGSM